MLDILFPAAHIQTLTNRLLRAGGDIASALASAGLKDHRPRSPMEPLPIGRFNDLEAYCRRWTGDPLFAINAAIYSTGEEFEWAAFALQSQPTLRDMLRMGIDNWDKVVSPVRTVIREEKQGLEVQLLPRQPSGPSLEIFIEFQMAVLLVVHHRALEVPIAPDRICLDHRPRTHKKAYQEAFGVPVEFEAGKYAFGISNAKLDLPLKHPDRRLARVAYQTWMREAGRFVPDRGNTAMIALQVLREEDIPDKWRLEGLARRLHMPPRTLQHQLRQCGTSFQILVDSARKELAAPLLERGLTQAEIAIRLGYADEGSLRKAFKRWYGRAPGKAPK